MKNKLPNALDFSRESQDLTLVSDPLTSLGDVSHTNACHHQANLDAFKGGDVRFLICTDVAARGVDIKGLPYVINMTLPDVPENYIHRIGRVGRQDCLGLAVSIVARDGCKEKVRGVRNEP